MNREVHVRFCEEQGAKSPLLTRLTAVLGQSKRTLKYMSTKIMIEENKIVKPKFVKLNFESNL